MDMTDNTQDLLMQMDNITGGDVKDISMEDNTQQIVQTIDQVTGDNTEYMQNIDQVTDDNPQQIVQNIDQVTNDSPQQIVQNTDQVTDDSPHQIVQNIDQVIDDSPQQIVQNIDQVTDHTTEQVVQNIDQVIYENTPQIVQNIDQVYDSPHQIVQNIDQITNSPHHEHDESRLTLVESSVCSSHVSVSDTESNKASHNQSASQFAIKTVDKDINPITIKSDGSNSEFHQPQGFSYSQQLLFASNEVQQTGLETEIKAKGATDILCKTKESSCDKQTLTGKVFSSEPPVKKPRVNQTETVSKPAFQFVPRNVSQSKSSSAVKTQENRTQNSGASCNKMADSLQTKQFSQTLENTTDSQTVEMGTPNFKISSATVKSAESGTVTMGTSSHGGIETAPATVKSYDANVVLPEDIVKTWRTSSDTKEGEIVELDSNYDGVYNCQPVCFARTDFNQEEDNYLRGCKWSPDGTCLLTNSNDNKLRVYNTPAADTSELACSQVVKECDTVYDFCWYNKMSSATPETCCFMTTCRDGPLHMWDMNTGKLKCTYRPYNHLDEMTTAHSMAFSLDGKKLYTGFNRMIRVFDVSRPGRECIQRPTFVKHQGQPGIISCIAASPQGMGIYAAGSYARAIALYHEPDGKMLCMFEGQQGGVTHIAFSPDGTKLYSGGRKDPEILCWDLRKPGQILFVALRLCETNQRLYFSQDESGRHLISGTHDGTICIWDTSKSPVKVLSESDPLLKPVMKFKAHNDCVNGICVNPKTNILASCSGQRHYTDFWDSNESDSDSVDSDVTSIENSVKLWKFKT